jgi:hypothetical protein
VSSTGTLNGCQMKSRTQSNQIFDYFRHVLASDQRYREDVIAWQMDDYDLAMDRKTKLEEI